MPKCWMALIILFCTNLSLKYSFEQGIMNLLMYILLQDMFKLGLTSWQLLPIFILIYISMTISATHNAQYNIYAPYQWVHTPLLIVSRTFISHLYSDPCLFTTLLSVIFRKILQCKLISQHDMLLTYILLFVYIILSLRVDLFQGEGGIMPDPKLSLKR